VTVLICEIDGLAALGARLDLEDLRRNDRTYRCRTCAGRLHLT
jgi:hypothetical protein